MLPLAGFSIGRFPIAFFRSLTNQNLFHTIAVGIPCFLLVECVALLGKYLLNKYNIKYYLLATKLEGI